MSKDSQYWLQQFASLRIDTARGDPAPHKPLLLLVILEMADKGEIATENIPLSANLSFRFSVFWSVVAERRNQSPDVRLPFHHLKSSQIWEPLTSDGKPSPDKKLTVSVRLEPDFFQCLQDSEFRNSARRLLIHSPRYFREPERIALCGITGLETTNEQFLKEEPGIYETRMLRGRDGRFRIDVVVTAYKHACAITGYRLTTVEMESIVDAAHIHEFSDSRNNDPRNGLALSKNSHWQFDRGLWSITDDYRIIVNEKKFTEEGGVVHRLSDFNGRRLFLPDESRFWPDPKYLAWHRGNHGFC